VIKTALKFLAKMTTLLMVFLLLGFMGFLLWVKSDHFLYWVQTKINASIPGHIHVASHTLSFLPLQINLYNAVLSDGDKNKLAGFSHLLIRVNPSALLEKALVLETIALESPWAGIILQENGKLNIAAALSPGKVEDKQVNDQKKLPLNLVFPSIELTEGQFSLTKADGSISLEASGIDVTAKGDLQARSGNLEIKIPDFRFAGSGLRPEPARMNLTVRIEDDHLHIPTLTVSSGMSNLRFSGTATGPFPETQVEAAMSISSQLAELKKAFDIQGDYQGAVTAEIETKGKLINPEAHLALALGKGSVAGQAVDQANLLVALKDRKVKIRETIWRLAGGSIALSGEIDLQKTFPSGLLDPPQNPETIAYTLDCITDIPNLHPWLENHFDLQGKATIEASLKGEGVVWPNLSAAVSMKATARDLIAPGMSRPIGADATVNGQMDSDGISLSLLEIIADDARLSGEGNLQTDRRTVDGQFFLAAEELTRILAVVGKPFISGSLETSIVVGGTFEKPRFFAELSSRHLKLDTVTIGDVETGIRLESGTLWVDQFRLSNLDSSLTATGNIRLFDERRLFQPVKDPEFDLHLVSKQFNPKHFIDSVSGDFSLNGSFSGSIEAPAGNIVLTGEQIDLFGQPLQSMTFDARVDEGRLWLDKAWMELVPGERIEAGGWLGVNQSMDLYLRSEGIDVSHLAHLKDLFPGDGRVRLDVSAKGVLHNPEIDARLTVTDIVINDQPIKDVDLDINLREMQAKASGHLNFDIDADYDVKNGNFKANFFFDQTETRGYFKAAGRQDLSGTLSGRINASGNVNRFGQLSADVDLKNIHLFHKDQTLIRSERLVAQLEDQRLSLPGFEATLLSSGHVRIKGEAGLESPLDVTAEGRVPIAAAAPFSEMFTGADGFVSFTGSLSGTADAARYDAQINLEQIGMMVPALGQRLHDLNGTIVLTPNAIQFKDFSGYVDTGSFLIMGAIGHDHFQPSDFDVTLQARSLPIEVPDTLTVLTNGDIRIQGEKRKAKATGEIVLLQGTYYKDIQINLLDIASSATTRRRAEPVVSKPLELPYMDSVDLNIALRHRQPFDVQNNLAELAIRPDLKIRGTLAKPIINGRAHVSDGIITFQRKEFEVKKGVIDFVDPYQTEADIDIESEAQIRDWTVTLAIEGTMDNLVFTLTSVPSETEADIVSLILFGRTTGELSGGKSGSSRTTNQIIAEMIADTFGEDIRKNTGIDILELESTEGSDDSENGGVKVTVGKHLSDRMTVKYAVETVDGQSTQWAIMEYKLLERIIVNGSQSSQGLFGGELIYRIEFR
jgi:autotransporter translocation and assembly factor TamB